MASAEPEARGARMRTFGFGLAGWALGLAILAVCFRSWPAFHAGIDFNAAPFEDFAGPYMRQAAAMHGDGHLEAGFLYPPSFALLLAPFANLSPLAASYAWLAVLLAATLVLWAAGWWVLRPVSPAVFFAYSLVFALGFPWVHDMHWGQVSTLCWALILPALLAWRAGRNGLASLLLSLAIAIKLYPAFFAVLFLLRGDWRSVLRTAAWSALWLFGLPALLMGPETMTAFYRDLLHWWRGSAQGLFWESPGSQFAPLLLHRLWGGPTGILAVLMWALPLGLAAILLRCAWRNGAAGRNNRALLLVTCTLPLVISPSWSHYFVWLPWALALAWREFEGLPARALLIFAALTMGTPAFLLVGGHPAYPLMGLLTLAAMAIPLAYFLSPEPPGKAI
ncbi:MAG: glycosyltransferase family 87 protein [Planctomycetota bacterium]